MDINHSQASWVISYDKRRLCGPQKLTIDSKTIFSFMHCRIDQNSDDAVVNLKSHHYHRSGCAVYEGSGDFTLSPTVSLPMGCTYRTAANAMRMTTDILWPKDTALATGIEIGSAVLGGKWCRFFTVNPEMQSEAQWREIDEENTSPISISPLPCAIVLENENGLRLEIGIGDDIWRWRKGFNSESLKGISRLEISRSGSKTVLRRFVTECPPPPRPPKLPAKPVPGASGKLPSTEPPRYVPDCRPYRFNSYVSWSASELLPPQCDISALPTLDCSGGNGLKRADLESLGGTPAFVLELSTLPVEITSHRNGEKNGDLCWCGRSTQNCYRRIIRQLAEYSKKGTVVLKGMVPGWCNVGTHANRKGEYLHWDLSAILDTAAWTRQILGDDWTIIVPQSGIFADMPSTSCLGAISGFRQNAEE